MEAVKYYRTPEMRRVFYARGPAEEKAISYGSSGEVIRSFSVGDLVSRFIPRRSRTKASDVWSEPMRVLQKLGDRDYSVWNGSRKMVVHVNDIKGVFLPSGVGWEVRPTLLDSFLEEWQVDRADLAPLGSSLPEVLRAQWEGKKILLPVSLREGSTVISKFKRDRPALLIWVVPHMLRKNGSRSWRVCLLCGLLSLRKRIRWWMNMGILSDCFAWICGWF
jgi:hypothetical protein